MEQKYPLLLIVSAMLAMATVTPAISQEPAAGVALEAYYAESVDALIGKYEALAAMRDCDSEAIRQAAECAFLKASFYKAFKDELVQELIEKKVAMKPHSVHYYLISRFADTVRANGTPIAIAQ